MVTRVVPWSWWRYYQALAGGGTEIAASGDLRIGQIVVRSSGRLRHGQVRRLDRNHRVQAWVGEVRKRYAEAVLSGVDAGMVKAGGEGNPKAAVLAYQRVGGWVAPESGSGPVNVEVKVGFANRWGLPVTPVEVLESGSGETGAVGGGG